MHYLLPPPLFPSLSSAPLFIPLSHRPSPSPLTQVYVLREWIIDLSDAQRRPLVNGRPPSDALIQVSPSSTPPSLPPFKHSLLHCLPSSRGCRH